jgi:integrase
MERLLAATLKRYRPLVAVCLFGGLRISEACGLWWREVDFDEGRIRVREQLGRDGKRRRIKTPAGRRDVILMPALASLLRRYKLEARHSRERDYVFATATGSALSTRNATRAFEKAVERAKLDGVTQHALRHTFASMLVSQGRDPVFVADQLGHKDPGVTLRVYSHLFRAAREARLAQDQMDACAPATPTRKVAVCSDGRCWARTSDLLLVSSARPLAARRG